MAQVIGKPSGYLTRESFRYDLRNLVIGLALLGGLYVFITLVPHLVAISSVGFIITVFVFMKVVEPMLDSAIRTNRRGSRRFMRGQQGEHRAEQVLRALPDSYTVFRDVILGPFGNIDYVVVGPNGVFVVEVKNHVGRIAFNGTELTRNGRPIREKDLLKQATRQSFQIREYLEQQAGIRTYVTAILLFTNKHAILSVGTGLLKNVHVVGPRFLDRTITTRSGALSAQQTEAIIAALRKTVRE